MQVRPFVFCRSWRCSGDSAQRARADGGSAPVKEPKGTFGAHRRPIAFWMAEHRAQAIDRNHGVP